MAWHTKPLNLKLSKRKNPPQSLRRQPKDFVEAERLRQVPRYTLRGLNNVKFN